jgi:signal transduction histidine kinase
MRFRNKILLSIWGVVLSLLVITFFIINYWMRARIEETFSRELRTALATILVHEKLQSAQLIRACGVIAESPRIRAVAELGDAETASQLLSEMNQTTLSQLTMLTDRRGIPLVQLLRGKKQRWDVQNSPTVRSALERIPATDIMTFGGSVYRVVSVPMVIVDDLVGTLTIGFEITDGDIAELTRATSSELVLVSGGAAVRSSLDSGEVRSLQPSLAELQARPRTENEGEVTEPLTLTANGETYLGLALRISRGQDPGVPGVDYLITKPLSHEVRSTMASILGTFGIVSVIFMLLTSIIGVVISRSITRPISDLVEGTIEIGRGNYDYPIHFSGRDELSVLGKQFTEMSRSLKEKISQLGVLNQNLTDRNTELDHTLRELRSAQEELVRNERLAATGKMTAQLAHEINNPIHNIQSCLKTALGHLPADGKGKELIHVAYDEVNRLSRLTGQMLNFYRVSLLADEQTPIQIGDLVSQAVALTAAELQAKGIRLESAVEPGLPPVRGSRDRLLQVLYNLITNARDAMPNGGTITIRASRAKKTVRVAVQDTGIGIPKANLPRIFDAFFTTKSTVSGVGLGLSVSHGIVLQHRGSLEVQSEEGKGSTFTVILPCEE